MLSFASYEDRQRHGQNYEHQLALHESGFCDTHSNRVFCQFRDRRDS